LFLHSPELGAARYPDTCPFCTERAGLTRQILMGKRLLDSPLRREMTPRPAARDQMERFHLASYLDALERASAGRMKLDGLHLGLGTSDCPIFGGMYSHAALAVGATLTGVELLLRGDADVAFNPSGGFHHAMPSRAAGFCYVNDTALACLRLADAGRRVAYVDIDAHHGDGTQHAAYARRDILTIDLHESGHTLFPGTGFENEIGEGDGRGFTVNVPLPAGANDRAFRRAFDAVAVPILGAFRPDVIVLELGLDGLAGDPLTHLAYSIRAYLEVIERTLRLGKPLLATGGGGYRPETAARGWALCWSALSGGTAEELAGLGLDDEAPESETRPPDDLDRNVDATIDLVRKNVFRFHGL
jgi:acetoin utilization protein AcuC